MMWMLVLMLMLSLVLMLMMLSVDMDVRGIVTLSSTANVVQPGIWSLCVSVSVPMAGISMGLDVSMCLPTTKLV